MECMFPTPSHLISGFSMMPHIYGTPQFALLPVQGHQRYNSSAQYSSAILVLLYYTVVLLCTVYTLLLHLSHKRTSREELPASSTMSCDVSKCDQVVFECMQKISEIIVQSRVLQQHAQTGREINSKVSYEYSTVVRVLPPLVMT